ncbi:MAG: TM0106 family RecB-like putative nuclease [Rhodospirillales bacterium]|nr:MAG: TM0106 family RecB-like putative nuclease [Rhodospirillales bacterium]
MFLSSGDLYRRYRPAPCDLRLYLNHQGVPAAEPGPYEQVIRRLGERYERAHLATFPEVRDLSAGTPGERREQTLQAIADGVTVLYQPFFHISARLAGRECDLGGAPDFLIRENGSYLVRDVKMSRRINAKDHPEILWQLRLYGWLLEQATGQAPLRLEVLAGTGEIVVIEPIDPGLLIGELEEIANLMTADAAPFAPVGWSKCGGCGYQQPCWQEAERAHSVALVPKADQGMVRALRESGVNSFDDLLAAFDVATLAAFRRPWGQQMRKVGDAAATDVLRSARALATGTMILIAPPQIPDSPNYVMFDLEGLPPQLDDLEKVYLWGMQVFGDEPSPFVAATAGFGTNGDQAGWEAYLGDAAVIFARYGDIPFVHWHHYERVKIDLYIGRYGDSDGIAARVKENLFDLLPATQKAVALPLPSYSLKVVEDYVGFARTQEEYGGDWAMARYIEATEMEDESGRDAVLAEILRYNEEDLAATWAVFCWLRDLDQSRA